jgi:hypothetical protein
VSRRLAVTVAVLAMLVAQPARGYGSHTVQPDGHALALYGDRQTPIGTITRTRFRVASAQLERFAVVVNPAHRFQFASDDGPGYLADSRVVRQYIELRSAPLSAPATRAGWRDPDALDTYQTWVTSFVGDLRPDGRIFIRVTTNPTRSGFLIRITTINLQPKGTP